MRKYFFFPVVLLIGSLLALFGASSAYGVTDRTVMLPETGEEEGAVLSFQKVDVIGDTVVLALHLNTQGYEATKIIADFVYPSDLLEVIGISVTDSPVKENFDTDYTTLGIVRFSYESAEVIQGDGDLGTITFRVLGDGQARLRFTDEAYVGVTVPLLETTNNVLIEATPATYDIKGATITELPQTGVGLSESELITGFIILIAIIMIILFVFSTFTIWGGVYLSLGKWKGKLVVGADKKALFKKMEKKNGKQMAAPKKKSKKAPPHAKGGSSLGAKAGSPAARKKKK
jgi:hypothetical protein